MWRDRGEVGGGVARDTNEDIGAARGADEDAGAARGVAIVSEVLATEEG
jgi:hypothetical protein